MKKFIKKEALKYLATANFRRDEWSEARMFHALCHVINEVKEDEEIGQVYLDNLIEEAEAN